MTPAAILLWKRSAIGIEGQSGERHLDEAEQSLRERCGEWSMSNWAHAVGQAIRSQRETPASLPRLDALGCGLTGAPDEVKTRVLNDAAYLAGWAAPEGEAKAGLAVGWLFHFVTETGLNLSESARQVLFRLLASVPENRDAVLANRVSRVRAFVSARCLGHELPAAAEAESRKMKQPASVPVAADEVARPHGGLPGCVRGQGRLPPRSQVHRTASPRLRPQQLLDASVRRPVQEVGETGGRKARVHDASPS